MKRYDSYKDSGVKWLGEIPSHWEMLALKHILKHKKEVVGKHSSQYDLLSLTLKGVIIRDMDNPEGKFPASFDTYQIVEPNDFIFCNFDNEETPRAVGLSQYKGMITGAYDVLYRNNPLLSDKYLIYYFLYIDDSKRFKPLYKGLRKTVPFDSFMSYKIPVPSRGEQDAVVEYLDAATSKIDEAIAQQQKMIDLLNERKQIIINNAVTKGLDPNVKMKPSGIDWIGDIPEHWELRKLKHIFKRIADGTHFSPVIASEGYPYITATDVNGRGLNYDSIKRISLKDFEALAAAGCRINKGDILIVKDGATTGRVGMKVDDVDSVALSSVAMLTPSKFTDNNYLMYAMMADMIKKQIDLSMAGAAMPRITLVKLSNFVCSLPCYDEQLLISNYIENKIQPIDNAVMSAMKQISLLQERKQIIINDVVTGKVKVV